MTNNILQECIEIVKDLVGNEYLYFDAPIEIKTSPHTFPFCAWGVCVSPSDNLYLMDDNEEWHEVEPGVGNAPMVIGTLYQRLQLMRRRYAHAS